MTKQNPSFILDSVSFPATKAHFGPSVSNKLELEIGIKVSATFSLSAKKLELTINTDVNSASTIVSEISISVSCLATFFFEQEVSKIESIPDLFYSNALGIVYPYIRAFITNHSQVAGYPPIILPLANLSSLGNSIKEQLTIAP